MTVNLPEHFELRTDPVHRSTKKSEVNIYQLTLAKLA